MDKTKKPYASNSIVEDVFDKEEARKHNLATTGRKKPSPIADTSYYTVHGKLKDVEKYLKHKDYPKEMHRTYKEHQLPHWKEK